MSGKRESRRADLRIGLEMKCTGRNYKVILLQYRKREKDGFVVKIHCCVIIYPQGLLHERGSSDH